MGMRILALEDRIVFDAVGAPDVDLNHQADAVTASFEPSPAPVADPGARDIAHDPVTVDGHQAADAGGDHAPLDNGGEVAPDAGEVRVLVVNSAINDAAVLAEAARDNVRTVLYDGRSADLDAILAQVRDALGGDKADSIAFAVHGDDRGNLVLARNQVVNLASLLDDAGQRDFWRDLGDSLKDAGRIDILACGLASTRAGRDLVAELHDLTGMQVAASDDVTGNPAAGGDWVLEEGNVDAGAVYFDAGRLGEFSGTLPGGEPVIAFLDAWYEDVGNIAVGGSIDINAIDQGLPFRVRDPDASGYNGGDMNITVSGAFAGEFLDLNGIALGGGDGVYNLSNAGGGDGTLTRVGDGKTVGQLHGYGSQNLDMDWTADTTDADIEYLLGKVRFNHNGNAADRGDRIINIALSDASGLESWADARVNVIGPVTTGNSASGLIDGGTINLQGKIAAADLDAGGSANIDFYLTDFMPQHGVLERWTAANGWNNIIKRYDSFTMADVDLSRIRYRHFAGEPRFDEFTFVARDTNNGQYGAERSFYIDGLGNAAPAVDLAPWSTATNSSATLYYTNISLPLNDVGLIDDSRNLRTVTLQLTNRPDGGNEYLDMDPGVRNLADAIGNILVSGYGTATMTLTSKSGSPIDERYFQEVIEHVHYYHTLTGKTGGHRLIKVTPNDGGQDGDNAWWDVYVEPDNGRPIVAQHYMALHRGSTQVIHDFNLRTVDANTGPADLTYTLDNSPYEGTVLLNGGVLGVGSTFTQAQINAGQLSYRHNGGGSGWGWDSFSFQVSDGTNTEWSWMELEIVPIDQPLWEPGQQPGVMDLMVDTGVGPEGFFGPMGFGFAVDTGQDAASSLAQGLDQDLASQADTEVEAAMGALQGVEAGDHGLDALLDMFGGDADATSLLGDAISEIKRAKLLDSQVSPVIGQAYQLLDLYQGPVKQFLQDLLKQADAASARMDIARGELNDLLMTAVDAGEHFDKAYSDAIMSQVVSLAADNDRVFVQEAVMGRLVEALREEGGDKDLERLRRLAREAREQAEQELRRLHARKDKAARDKVAASVRQLLNQRQPAGPELQTPKDQEGKSPATGQPGDGGETGETGQPDGDVFGDAGLERSRALAEAGTLLAGVALIGTITPAPSAPPASACGSTLQAMRTATAVLSRTRVRRTENLLAALEAAARG